MLCGKLGKFIRRASLLWELVRAGQVYKKKIALGTIKSWGVYKES